MASPAGIRDGWGGGGGAERTPGSQAQVPEVPQDPHSKISLWLLYLEKVQLPATTSAASQSFHTSIWQGPGHRDEPMATEGLCERGEEAVLGLYHEGLSSTAIELAPHSSGAASLPHPFKM